MTKVGNRITIKDQTYRLYGSPLEKYWEIHGKKHAFAFSSNPLDLGYFAHWSIVDSKLYLLDFFGRTLFTEEHISFENAFPEHTLPLYAEWFTGTLQVQIGNVIFTDYHFGESLESTMTLTFHNGELKDITMRDTA